MFSDEGSLFYMRSVLTKQEKNVCLFCICFIGVKAMNLTQLHYTFNYYKMQYAMQKV